MNDRKLLVRVDYEDNQLLSISHLFVLKLYLTISSIFQPFLLDHPIIPQQLMHYQKSEKHKINFRQHTKIKLKVTMVDLTHTYLHYFI